MCNNTIGSFVCDCLDGYRLDEDMASCKGIELFYDKNIRYLPTYFFHDFKDIDECLESLDNCDNSSAICTNTIGGFNCSCTNGFTGDGINCSSMTLYYSFMIGDHKYSFNMVDIDECELGIDDCHPNATCVDTVGSFECNCDPGFTGSGVECSG